MELEGVVGSPYKHPEVRKKLPAPFARPSINLDGGIHRKRSWKDTPVIQLKAGDVVSDIGRLDSVEEFVTIPGKEDAERLLAESDRPTMFWRVRLVNVFGNEWVFPGHQRLYAFTEDTNG